MTDKAIYQDPTQPIEARVEDLVSKMTLEEKASQMLFNSPAIERLGIPEYNWWNECLHGVARNGRATVFPQIIGLAATFNRDMVRRVATAISDEARAKHHQAARMGRRGQYQGLTFWTPNINIFRDPRWGRGQETYGEDPYLTGELGAEFVKGLQGDNPRRMKAAACAKHYAVHSGPEGERHSFNAVVGKKDLYETYLPAFKKLVDAGVESVMGAYNRTNDEPCCASKLLLDDILRGEWKFQGHVVSDCGALNDIHQHHKFTEGPKQTAALAIQRGCDLNCGNAYVAILEAAREGLLKEEEIDVCLKRLLRTKFKLGLLDPAGSGPYEDIPSSVIDCDAHRKLALEAATESIVLLKNENNLLPLKKDTDRLCVCGPHAADVQVMLGNYFGLNPRMVTILEGIVDRISSVSVVEYMQGEDAAHEKRNDANWVFGPAKESDVVIAAVGLDPLMEGEEGEAIRNDFVGDRRMAELPRHQVEFIQDLKKRTEKPLVVILTGGAAMAVPEIHEAADAVLQVWYPGEEGGHAVADVLFGNASPSGRMPVTAPKSTDDLPPFEDYNMEGRTYRYMEKEALYPFGFGLSYSRFAYSDLKLESDSIQAGESLKFSVRVKNEGERASDEVAQVYLKDLEASVRVPLCQLVDFAKIHLLPGASETVDFILPAEAMALVDEDGKSKIEAGRFRLIVGGASPGERSKALGAAEPQAAEFDVK